ncbi:OprD family outer membrane porin, partial [Pseudomonas viridiflava]
MNTFFQRTALPSLLLSVAPWVSADGFIEDSKLKLQLRNVYFNENFRDEHGLSTRAALTARSER